MAISVHLWAIQNNFTINIKGNDYELKKNKPVEFDKVFQVNEFNEQFKKALQEAQDKEDEMEL